MQKNVASQIWIVFAFDETDNTAKTGDSANITANLRLNGGAADATDTANPTELEDGYYYFPLTQAETNANNIVICPSSTTANIQVIGVPGAVYTTAPNFNALGIESDGDLTKVNTLDGHTAQTGDSYARIGVAGAGLTNIDLPNQTMDITGNITGNLSGSVGSVTGAVGSVTGNVGGDVVGSVASVVGNVGGNVVGSVASVTGSVDSVTNAVGSVTGNVGGNVVGTVASVVGDVGGNVVGSVASVAGNVDGNVTGSVGSLVGHTVQTGDNYPIVSHADYGNAQLVRSTTPANTLDVSATGEAGLDFDNIKDATGAHTLTNITVPNVTTVATTTTNTDMRGTNNAALAATALTNATWTDAKAGFIDVAISSRGTADPGDNMNLADNAITSAKYDESTAFPIKSTDSGATQIARTGADSDTLETLSDQIDLQALDSTVAKEATVAALNDLSAADVNAEVDTALEDIHLDHLLAVDYDPASKPGVGTALLNELIENDGGVSRYTANALEQAPGGGGGGDATAANQTIIINHLTDVKGGTFNGATDSLEAIRDRGDVAWVSGSLTGSNTVTLTLYLTGTTTPILDARLEIWNFDLSSILTFGITDANGQISFTADNGNYKVKFKKSGYSFTTPDDLTVSGDTTTTYYGDTITITEPSESNTCRVYEFCYGQDGLPVQEAYGIARIVSIPLDDGGVLYTNDEVQGTYNSENGLIYWDIVYGAQVKFTISDFGIIGPKIIPEEATKRISDI